MNDCYMDEAIYGSRCAPPQQVYKQFQNRLKAVKLARCVAKNIVKLALIGQGQ